MSRTLAVALALSATILGAVPAMANGGRDRVPAPIPVPAPMPIQESFSYYLRADLGWGFGDPSFSESGAEFGVGNLPYSGLTGATSSTSDVFHGSIGAGAYWTPRFRTDVTLDFRGTQEIDASATYTDPGPVDGVVRDIVKLRGTVGLFNAYWDLMPRGSFTPYVGAGVGFVFNQIDRTHVNTEDPGGIVAGSPASSSANNFGLAAAVMAGVSFSWNHGWVLDVGYRGLYMDGGDITTIIGANASRVEIGSQWEHQVRVGLRANLW